MGQLLSAAELDALDESSPDNQTGRVHDARAGTVLAYNFRRPDRVSKEQIRSLHLLHDRFARNATTSLAAYLRATTELSVISVEQFSYAEFLLSLPDPTAFYAVAMDGFDALAALELSPSIAFTIVDRMLGGTGQTGTPNRALTEIEQNVVDSIVKLLLDHLSETWKAVSETRFRVQGRETRPQMLQVAVKPPPRIGWWFRRRSRRLRIPTDGGPGARRHIRTTQARIDARRIGRIRRPVAGVGLLQVRCKVPWGFLELFHASLTLASGPSPPSFFLPPTITRCLRY